MTVPRDATRGIESISRAIDILEVLTEQRDFGLVELALRTGLSPSTTHRVLATLAVRGYVRRNPESGRYQLSHRVLYLAGGMERWDARLRVVARPYMERIHKVCHETTNLVVLEGPNIVYVDQMAGSRSVRMFAEPGRRVPAHATAAGKALLAFSDRETVDRVLDGVSLERFTVHTITTRTRLLRELSRVRATGFALDREEYEGAVTCVAAPLFDHGGEVAGALSVSGPTGRLGGVGDYDALGELIGRAAIEASRELGYPGGSVWDAGR